MRSPLRALLVRWVFALRRCVRLPAAPQANNSRREVTGDGKVRQTAEDEFGTFPQRIPDLLPANAKTPT